MITTFERGNIEGKIEGKIEGQREAVLLQLEAKFGKLAPEVAQRVEGLAADRLRHVVLHLVKAASLKELHLED